MFTGQLKEPSLPCERLLCVMLAAGIAVSGQAVDPEQRLRQLSMEQLSQIEVTSVTKEPVTAFQTPAAINILTNADIRRSGARNIPDLLRLIPGVNVAQIYSNQWAIGIRGFQGELSKSVLVLIDGRSVYTPLFAGVFWEMQDVMLEDVDRIEVIRGPAGVIWGSNAVNGVINIITKNARETRGAIVSAGGGNVDQGFLNWRYGAGDDNLSYRVYGKGSTIGPQFHSDGQNYDDWRRGQIGFRIDAQPSPKDALTLQGDAYGAEAGQILRLHSYSPPSSRLNQANKFFNGQNIMAAWRRAMDSGADIQVRTYYDRTDREEQNFHEIRHTFDIDFIHRVPKGRHEITWGLGTRISPASFMQVVPTVDFLPHNHVYNIFSAFLQDDISLIPNRLALTLGSKFEYTTWSGFNYQPSARVSWTPNREHTYWASITRAVRTASWIEDSFRFDAFVGFTQGVPNYIRLLGDGGFTQEEMIGYEAGYRQNIAGHGFISLSLFHNNYDDLLSIEPSQFVREGEPDAPRNVLPVPFRNGLRAKTSGGELAGLWDITDWWRARSSYSLVEIDAKPGPSSMDQTTTRQVQGETPAHKFLAQSSFALPMDFELDVFYRYVSSVPGFRIPSYSTGDIRFARRIGDHFEFEVVGRNLLQPRHLEYGVENPPVAVRRAGYLSLTWTP